MHPALAHALVGEPVGGEQQQTDREAGLDRSRPWSGAVKRCDLRRRSTPSRSYTGPLHQLVLQNDDLLEPGPEQIA